MRALKRKNQLQNLLKQQAQQPSSPPPVMPQIQPIAPAALQSSDKATLWPW